MLTKVDEDGEQKIVTVRVIKEHLMEQPFVEESVKLCVAGSFVVEGIVSRTYRLSLEKE